MRGRTSLTVWDILVGDLRQNWLEDAWRGGQRQRLVFCLGGDLRSWEVSERLRANNQSTSCLRAVCACCQWLGFSHRIVSQVKQHACLTASSGKLPCSAQFGSRVPESRSSCSMQTMPHKQADLRVFLFFADTQKSESESELEGSSSC
jgi:hypothetical protein